LFHTKRDIEWSRKCAYAERIGEGSASNWLVLQFSPGPVTSPSAVLPGLDVSRFAVRGAWEAALLARGGRAREIQELKVSLFLFFVVLSK